MAARIVAIHDLRSSVERHTSSYISGSVLLWQIRYIPLLSRVSPFSRTINLLIEITLDWKKLKGTFLYSAENMNYEWPVRKQNEKVGKQIWIKCHIRSILIFVVGPLKAIYTFSPPGRPVHSDTNSVSQGSILGKQQLRVKTNHSHFHHCL